MDLLVKADSKIALDVVVHDEAMLVELHTKKVLMLLIAWLIQESACRNVAKVLASNHPPAAIHRLGLQAILPEQMEVRLGTLGFG